MYLKGNIVNSTVILQKESPDESYFVLSLIIPNISSFAMCSAAGAMVVFVYSKFELCIFLFQISTVAAVFQQNWNVYLRLEITSGDA